MFVASQEGQDRFAGYPSDGGPANSAVVNSPQGVALDSDSDS